MNTNQRILGFDFARGLAVMGMIIVNFKTVMVASSVGVFYNLLDILSGKAAALFVVLAGIGMTLMYNGAKLKNDDISVKKTKINLLKRAAFLFVIGLSYYLIWPADILHYYGLYLSVGVIFLAANRIVLQIVSIILIIGYSISLLFFNYETGWNWSTLNYTDFFTISGFLRNLFFNGFHPVIPWIAFLLTGIWVGRINFKDPKILKKTTIISLLIFVIFKVISLVLISSAIKIIPSEAQDIEYLLGTSPMPPMFFYMVTASSLAVFIISISIYLTNKQSLSVLYKMIINLGQLALSIYIFHVVIGMFAILIFTGKLENAFSVEFVFIYGIGFNILMLLFSFFWLKRFKRGPVEYLMRKITG